MPDLFHPDTPIQKPEEDQLGRNGLAVSMAAHVRSAPITDGFVIGLYGPWGSGKSSVLHLMEHELSKAPDVEVLWFNPWLFSGTHDLLTHFFSVMGNRLKLRNEKWSRELGNLFQDYGGLLTALDFIPGISGLGSLGSIAMRGTGGLINRRAHAAESLETKRRMIRAALAKTPKRLVFVIDDLDRLHNAEVLEVMRLVRLVGDFPKCIYVIAFDADRIAAAVSRDGGDGHEYLEKIVQVVFEVPPVRRTDLHKILIAGIAQAEDTLPHGPLDMELWQNVYTLGMFPLFRKVRDIRRYLNVLPVTMNAVGEEVALADVLVLEAVRVLRPDIYVLLYDAVPALSQVGDTMREGRKAANRKTVEDILAKAGPDRDALDELLTRLFPATQQYLRNQGFSYEWINRWSKDRRVAHERVLRFYLERSYPPGAITNVQVKSFFERLRDEVGLREMLGQLTVEQLEELLTRLEDYQEDYPRESVGPATLALFSQLPRLSDEMRGMFDFSPQSKLTRVVYRLLKRLGSAGEPVILEVLRKLPSLTAKRIFLLMVGHQKGAGHGFIAKEIAGRLEKELAADIANAPAAVLAAEQDPLRLAYWVRKFGTSEDLSRFRDTAQDEGVFLALLTDALQYSWSTTMGDVASKAKPILAWDILEEVLDPNVLRERIQGIPEGREGLAERTTEALQLARKYASGWRPKGFESLEDAELVE
jgi:predicted KAP-like P-loop ATPase